MQDEHERNVRNQPDRRKVLGRIVGQFLVEGCADCERAASCHHQRVTVRCGFSAGRGADGGARTRPVLDNDWLAEVVTQSRCQRATERVDGAARRPGSNQRDLSGRIVLLLGARQQAAMRPRRRDPRSLRVVSWQPPLMGGSKPSMAPVEAYSYPVHRNRRVGIALAPRSPFTTRSGERDAHAVRPILQRGHGAATF